MLETDGNELIICVNEKNGILLNLCEMEDDEEDEEEDEDDEEEDDEDGDDGQDGDENEEIGANNEKETMVDID